MDPKKIKNEIYLTIIALAFSLIFSGYWVFKMAREILLASLPHLFEQTVFLFIGVGVLYGSIIYFMTRWGRLIRHKKTSYQPCHELDKHFFGSNANAPSLSILIPSYKEEVSVVEMTLLSAALLEYPKKNIVLLVDDPEVYQNLTDQRCLEETLALPKRIQQEFKSMRQVISQAQQEFIQRVENAFDIRHEGKVLADLYESIRHWFQRKSDAFMVQDHAQEFFADQIIDCAQKRMRILCREVLDLRNQSEMATIDCVVYYYRKALSIFNTSLTTFQRKRYENLSHEPNKAMNLNSYIGLMGRCFREERHSDGSTWLLEDKGGDIDIPGADYLITLDADSLLACDYAKRLIYLLEQPAYQRVAVAQTPYNTFRCQTVDLERVAGATTDIQHLIHQGFEYFGGSFWVGANALLRTVALEDIKENDVERGHQIFRYIQDRTVIEDTESSIDLVLKNWQVYNYLDCLSYSATPPDFGSLAIQRRRWANGGLIILPKLISFFFSGPYGFRRRIMETFVRLHYLISIALVNVGVSAMIFYPFDGNLHILPLAASALIYFLMYSRDLIQLRYKTFDVLRVYALNLLLIPINLAGVFKSVEQMVTRKKIPFSRTPKKLGRTIISPSFVIAEFGILFYLFIGFIFDMAGARYEHAIFSAINGCFFLYGFTYFIGWGNAYEDLRVSIFPLRRR